VGSPIVDDGPLLVHDELSGRHFVQRAHRAFWRVESAAMRLFVRPLRLRMTPPRMRFLLRTPSVARYLTVYHQLSARSPRDSFPSGPAA
jgi:hypothetical protein